MCRNVRLAKLFQAGPGAEPQRETHHSDRCLMSLNVASHSAVVRLNERAANCNASCNVQFWTSRPLKPGCLCSLVNASPS